jgi:tetratricopeptide (TPR) repeat protein
MGGDIGNVFPALGKGATLFVASLIAAFVAKSWLIDKAMDNAVALGLISGIFVDAILIVALWNSPLAYLLAIGGILGLIAMAAMPEISLFRGEKQHLEDEVERYRSMIARDPKNAAAHEFLADTLVKKRLFDEAIESYQRALDLTPQDFNAGLRAKLRRASEERR